MNWTAVLEGQPLCSLADIAAPASLFGVQAGRHSSTMSTFRTQLAGRSLARCLADGPQRADNNTLTHTHTHTHVQVARWRIAERTGLNGRAAEAQEYLMGHANRVRRLANIQVREGMGWAHLLLGPRAQRQSHTPALVL